MSRATAADARLCRMHRVPAALANRRIDPDIPVCPIDDAWGFRNGLDPRFPTRFPSRQSASVERRRDDDGVRCPDSRGCLWKDTRGGAQAGAPDRPHGRWRLRRLRGRSGTTHRGEGHCARGAEPLSSPLRCGARSVAINARPRHRHHEH